MKRPCQDDDVERLREQFGQRIKAAASSIAEVVQTAADLLIAITYREPETESPSREDNAPPVVPEMMTTEQAAAYLSVDAGTLGVWRCTRRYAIPFVKVGRKVRYRKADLDKFIRSRTHDFGREDESR